MSIAAALSLERLEKRYGDFVALKPLSLEVPAGTFMSVLGRSGSGKTTILRLIGGFTEPTAGRIVLGGVDLTGMPIFRRPCNTVFQDYALFPHLSVRQNVAYGLSIRGRPRTEVATRVDEILSVVGLEKMADRMPSQLSGGQKQRVALARALICEPSLMLLDEPLAALDAEMRRHMQDFLKAQQRRSGITFLFVTHDQQEAIGVSDLVLLMCDGGVEQVASPRDLYYRPRTAFAAQFFGDNNLVPATVTHRTGGAAKVETACGAFVAANPNDCPEGSAVLLATRPESISIGPAGQWPDQRLNGTVAKVTDVTFGGSSTYMKLAAGDTHFTALISSGNKPLSLHPGDEVRMQWSPESSVLVPTQRPADVSFP